MKPDVKWFRVLTVSGKDGGIGFECSRCRSVVPHSIDPGQGVTCGCGTHTAPTRTDNLETKRLGGRHHDSRFILTSELENGDPEPNSNTEIFENERRMRWV